MTKRKSAERGSALILSLMLAAVAVLAATAYISVSITDRRIAANETDRAQAFNLADAGLDRALAEMPDVADVDALLAAGGNLFTNEGLGSGAYTVTVTNNVAPGFPAGSIPVDAGGANDDTDGYLVLNSVGTVEKAVKEVSVLIVMGSSTPGPFPWGIYGDVKVQTSGGIFEDCHLRSNGDIDPGSTVVQGDATAGGIVKNPGQVTGTVTEGAPTVSYPTVACPGGGYTPAASVPSGPGITYDDSSGIVKLSNSANFALAPGTYYFKELSASTLATLSIVGSGHVDLYLDLKLDFKGASQLNPAGNPEDLTVYGCGTGPISIDIKDGGVNNVGIYAPTAGFAISSGTEVYGAVLAREFKMSGNSSFHCDAGLAGSSGGGGTFAVVPRTWKERLN